MPPQYVHRRFIQAFCRRARWFLIFVRLAGCLLLIGALSDATLGDLYADSQSAEAPGLQTHRAATTFRARRTPTRRPGAVKTALARITRQATPTPPAPLISPTPTWTSAPVLPSASPTPPLIPEIIPTATPQAAAGQAAPRILITEFLADPGAVGDTAGEWIELYNAESAAINLNGWTIADLDSDAHLITTDLIIPPGGYVVLGRNGDSTTNGGVAVDYVYTGISLSNSEDELLLIAPDGAEADRVMWGGTTGLSVSTGASLERTTLADPAQWATAQLAWAGSAGDLGTPGVAYSPPPTPTPTAMPTATPPLPQLWITEVMVNPDAARDVVGEYIEIWNGESSAVNLNGWTVADLGSESHTIAIDLWVPAGGYVVLARNGNMAVNGGVPVNYVYAGFTLANSADEVLLIAPNGAERDRIEWGDGTGLSAPTGTSLERATLSTPATWTIAQIPWPGSAGDAGSPGASPVPTPTPTPTISLATVNILISEVMPDPAAVGDSDGEWIELYNAGPDTVNLDGWILADLGTDQHVIGGELLIAPGQYVVLARNGDSATNGGVAVDYVYNGMSLSNSADEVLLLAPGGTEVDRVVWGDNSGVSTSAGASLERTTLGDPAVWTTAQTAWPGSAGDLGSPGGAFVPPATPTPTATAGPVLPLYLSEVLADPQAVADSDGEWIEIHNPNGVPVNLRGWQLIDLGGDAFVVDADVMVPTGGYVVLARNGDPATNGGVAVDYVYSGMSLSNSEDEVILLTPGGVEMDRITWGPGTDWRTTAGASLERVTFDAPAQWATGQTPWIGSAGDSGTPGSAYVPPSLTPTAVPSPTSTPPDQWTPADAPSPLQIDEVAYRGSDGEYVALINSSGAPVSLRGWSIGDAQVPGSGEGLYVLPEDVQLFPGEIFVVARNGAAFRQQWGRLANAETEESDPDTPTLARRREWARGSLALSDGGDEIVLLDAAGRLADAVAYGNGEYAALGLRGEFQAATGFTLQRVPGARFPTEPDVRHRFLAGPPDPFAARVLPAAQPPLTANLDGGLIAAWGSLGGHSNFTPGYTAPPHYVAAATAAEGLGFLALADPAGAIAAATAIDDGVDLARISAWGWQGANGEEAVIYGTQTASAAGAGELLAFLRRSESIAQWQAGNMPSAVPVVSTGADDINVPDRLNRVFSDWAAAALPLLPAGNSNPTLPGMMNPAPRYTGLAVSSLNVGDVHAAIAARRGWVTSQPGLWLTLGATLETGEWRWMGQHAPAANVMTVHIYYGDLEGQPAGLALWQDGRPIQQLDLPPSDGRWTVTIPAMPGSFIYAVATQFDGDFAVTAPIRILPAADGSVVINEVLPAPQQDLNGDGEVDSNDEFIELYNPGTQPISLAGWQLSDDRGDASPGSRFTFGADRYIGGGEWLLLWRGETRVSLNDDGDYVRLLDANGTEVDVVRWTQSSDAGRSFSRLPDGETWHADTPPSPGASNRKDGSTGGGSDDRSDDKSDDGDAPTEKKPPVIAPRPESNDDEDDPVDHHQAAGPPNSLASAKRQGLDRWVEFRAQVIVPPGYFNSSIYVADPAPAPDGPYAGLGINVYLWRGDFPPLQEGDWVMIRGETDSFRGEMEVFLREPGQIWRIGPGTPLLPLPIDASNIGEALEGRLVTFVGAVQGWGYDSIYLADPSDPDGEAVRVAVRSSLDWRRPYVNNGELWHVTGVVSQLAQEAPWNDGYRVLVRYENDLVRLADPASVADAN